MKRKWSVERIDLDITDSECFEIMQGDKCICGAYTEDDANLIALAPEMYEFIKSLQLSTLDDLKRDELLAKVRANND